MNSHSPGKRARTFLSIIAVLALNVGIIVPATVMAANPSANLDQCANDQTPSTRTSTAATRSESEWVNGNLGASKSVYIEGDSIPYRLTFGNLVACQPHRDDRVGHDEGRQARARLPHDLQPHRGQREPVPRRQSAAAHPPPSRSRPTRRCGRAASRRSPATSPSSAGRSPASAPTPTRMAPASPATSPHGSRSPSRPATPTLCSPGAATSPTRLDWGLVQLRGRDLRLAVPHPPDRPRRLRRQPGPLALG